jgi:hypothetical protein
MWDGKSRDGEGIAIKTTPRKLRDSLDVFKQEEFFIGMVEYGDYDEPDYEFQPEAWLNAHLHKPIEFVEESEIRASFTTFPTPDADPFVDTSKYNHLDEVPLNWDKQPEGIPVPVDTNKLIDEVYLSPYCDGWQKNVIKMLLADNGIEARVKSSRIYDS